MRNRVVVSVGWWYFALVALAWAGILAVVASLLYLTAAFLLLIVPVAAWWVWRKAAPPKLSPEVESRLLRIRDANDRFEASQRELRDRRGPRTYRTTRGRTRPIP